MFYHNSDFWKIYHSIQIIQVILKVWWYVSLSIKGNNSSKNILDNHKYEENKRLVYCWSFNVQHQIFHIYYSGREQVKQYIKIIQKGGRNGGMGQLLLTGIGKE